MNCFYVGHGAFDEQEGETGMELTFALPDGTRAGIVPTRDLRDFTVKLLGMECLTPGKEVSVVFYVSNKKTLDRILERFGSVKC
jgi:hypothetical protein